MKDKRFSIHYHGVSRIITPLKAYHEPGILCEDVHNLSFAFISPLGANYYDVRHI
jgi:hypothetical protein